VLFAVALCQFSGSNNTAVPVVAASCKTIENRGWGWGKQL